MQLGSDEKAKEYLEKAYSVMLPDGAMPELYYANSNKYNGNCPLGWSNSLVILAEERLESIKNKNK